MNGKLQDDQIKKRIFKRNIRELLTIIICMYFIRI